MLVEQTPLMLRKCELGSDHAAAAAQLKLLRLSWQGCKPAEEKWHSEFAQSLESPPADKLPGA